MKKKLYMMMAILMIATSIFCQQANAQAPQGIPYQAVARDNAGNLIKNQPISLRFSIHDGTANGNVVYSETHSVTTDALGLFSVNIGGGTPPPPPPTGGGGGVFQLPSDEEEGGVGQVTPPNNVPVSLSDVNWGAGAKFTQVELDVAGGTNFVDMGTTQMMSVPYALYAGKSNTPNGSGVGNTIRWDGNTWVADNALFNNGYYVGIGTDAPTEKLEVVGNAKVSGTLSANGGTAGNYGSAALGEYSNASGILSTTFGFHTIAEGRSSLAMGHYTTAKSFAETVIGSYNTNYTPVSASGQIYPTDRAFVIGNGFGDYSRSDAMVVLKNGNTTINGTTTANSFVKANGTSSQYLMADGSTSIGGTATTMGEIGTSSTANGGTITSGVLSLAPADESNAGIVTTGAQNFAGNKSLNGKLGIGINTNNSSAQLEVVSGSDIAIKAYPQNASSSQIGVLGTYNQIGFGTGIAGVAYGGTNPPTGNNDLGVYGSSSDIAIWSNGSLKVTDGTQGSGKVLTSDGNGKASWQTSTSTSMGAIGTSSNANGAAISSGVLSLTPADGTNGGIVTSSAQTFAGKKTFADSAVAKGFRATDSLTTKGFRATGTATANSFVKTGGTSSQILMADGSTTTVSTIASSTPVAMPTIQIGNQLWSKENLDVSFYRNGDEIPYVDNATTWAGLTTGAWCYYNNDPANGEKYGKLYNWYAVNDARGLAPQGWHIPSDAEWTILTTKLGESPGGKMKTAGTTNWSTPNTGATNSSGFAGLPGGCRGFDGSFFSIGASGNWWSSTESSTTNAWYRNLYYGGSNVDRDYYTKRLGFSVRCVRD
jgi:uncharacterized protein (TIGR02145 family)